MSCPILRVLALHGHAMTATGFEKKSGSIRNELKKLGVEFAYPQAPIVSPEDPLALICDSSCVSPQCADHPGTAGTSPSTADSGFSWIDFWSNPPLIRGSKKMDEQIYVYKYVARGIRTLSEYCAKNCIYGQMYFHCILAFSQGNVIVLLWIALIIQELNRIVKAAASSGSKCDKCHKNVYVPFDEQTLSVDDSTHPSQWRLPTEMLLILGQNGTSYPFSIINVSGAPARDKIFAPFIEDLMRQAPDIFHSYEDLCFCSGSAKSPPLLNPIHVLNCYGTADNIVSPRLSIQLAEMYASAFSCICGTVSADENSSIDYTVNTSEIWTHDGGHFLPASFRKPLRSFIKSVYKI